MTAIASPVLYDPSIEVPEENEAGIGWEIVATLNRIGETTLSPSQNRMREAGAIHRITLLREEDGLPGPLLDPAIDGMTAGRLFILYKS